MARRSVRRTLIFGASLLAVATVFVVLPNRQADSKCCVAYDYAHATGIQNAIINFLANTVITTILNRINVLEESVVEALRRHSSQNIERTSREIQAMEQIAAAQDARDAQRAIESATYHAARTAAPLPNTCQHVTGLAVTGLAGLASSTHVARATRAADILDFMMGATPRTRAAESPLAGLAQRLTEVCATDASEDLVRARVCPQGSQVRGAISPAVNAGTLFYSTVHGNEDARSAALFTANLMGRPVGPLPADIATRPDAIETVSAMHTAAARRSVAAAILADAAARRRPIRDENLRRWAEGTASQIIGYDPSGQNFPHGVSHMAVMELRANQWFHNPQWVALIDTNPDAAVKQTALIASWLALMAFEQFRATEQTNVALASILAVLEERLR